MTDVQSDYNVLKGRGNMKSKKCKIESCNNKIYAKGYCRKHYMRLRRYGDPLFTMFSKNRENHGMSNTPVYYTWQTMKQRCLNPNNTNYKYYGGRGITMCDRWLSFNNFYIDMGDRPENKELDRIDNNGNYEPKNCRWTTPAENSQNTRITKLTPEKVKEIRLFYPFISSSLLAKHYGVDTSEIRDVANYKVWKNVY